MGNSIYGLTNYYNMFASPLKSYEVNPSSNLIYGAMVSKVYSQTFAKKTLASVSSYLSSLNSNMSGLKSSAKPFTDKGQGLSFNQKAVTSADNSSISGTAQSNADIKSYTLNASKLAKSQSNSGVQLDSNQDSSFNTGLNTFTLKIGKTEKNISFAISHTDTNKTGLDKMASAINFAEAGVTATVMTNAKTGISFIQLASDKTGTDNSFSLTDKTGNAVFASGSASIAEHAQDAEYTAEGKTYTSQSNTIALNNDKVHISFSKAEGKDIKVTVGTDIEAIKSDIKAFVESYNKTLTLANTYSSELSGAREAAAGLGSIVDARKHALQDIGISINADNTLSVNEDKLEKAVVNSLSYIKDTFGGYNGITEKVYSKANEILTSPVKYSKPAESSSEFNNFYNYMSANRLNSAQNIYRGLVVDMML